ncbi:MAG: heat-inducible transcription repressor HrcA [Clostridia bacterium]|nr:heat-inducible transcription repressor HrcA [Clostridia bacterium]
MKADKLSERKQKILKAVVDEYINNASPISSGEIKAKYFDDISSATIRNELSALEEMGYLIQPHTSAGRIPSKEAYALYVDRFLDKQPLRKEEIALIENAFKDRFDEIEDIVRRTARVISDVTNYTSVIVLKNINKVVLKEIKLIDLDQHTVLLVIITDSGIIRDKVITLRSDVNLDYVRDANIMLNRIFAGKTISEIKMPDGMIEENMAEFRELYESVIAILESYAESAEDTVYMDGQSKFLEYPEHDLKTTRDFLQIVDTKERLAEIIEDDTDIEFSVRIGKDEKGGIDKCAIVTAKYMLNGKEIGHAGVIGPERMDYSKVMRVLKYITKALGEIADGGNNDKKRID